MPVVQVNPALSSPPSNAYGLVQFLQGRLPGYDTSEYLRDLNSAYIHVWEEISKLKNNYFTNQKKVTVNVAQLNYDLMFNADSGLSAAVSSRLYQITRIRVQPPSGGLFQATRSVHYNDPAFLSASSNPSPTPTQSGPYYYIPTGRGNVVWATPLAVGTIMEVTYTFWPIGLTYQSGGTVASSGSVITGSGTSFTSMVQPDFASNLPSVQGQEEIQAELVCNGTVPSGGQVYRVGTITSDTALTTITSVSPALAASSAYVLATLPEIPREHIRVIAGIALKSMYSVAGDDSRVQEWAAISEKNIQAMKDALMERQSQNPPSKGRFPYGISRRNRTL